MEPEEDVSPDRLTELYQEAVQQCGEVPREAELIRDLFEQTHVQGCDIFHKELLQDPLGMVEHIHSALDIDFDTTELPEVDSQTAAEVRRIIEEENL